MRCKWLCDGCTVGKVWRAPDRCELFPDEQWGAMPDELQVKDPSKRPKSATLLDVFRDSAAGALPATWAKLPQSLVLRGEDKGWRNITKQCKDFSIGTEPKIRKNTQGKEQK